MEDIVEKIQKLLRLSESSNPNEAALAAQRASEMMLKYNISKAVIESAENPEKRESVLYQMFDECPGKNRNFFRGDLANSIAAFFDTKILWKGNDLWLIGTASDMNAVKYLFGAILNQIEELTESEWWRFGKWQGVHGKTWKGSFRQGCLDEVRRRLAERKQELNAEYSQPSNSKELVVVDQHRKDVADFLRKLSISTISRTQKNVNGDAYNAGKTAGSSVNIGGNSGLGMRRNIGSSALGLGLKR